MEDSKIKNIPTVFVIFGATGDLMAKKITPALFHLYRKNRLPKLFKVIGVAHSNLTEKEFKNYIAEILKKHSAKNIKEIEKFVALFSFKKGSFEGKKNYKNLAENFLTLIF